MTIIRSRGDLLFDMCASSTVATVVAYEKVKNSDNGYQETVLQMTVLDVGCAILR